MRAIAEGKVAVVAAREREALGVDEHLGIAIGGVEEREDPFAAAHGAAFSGGALEPISSSATRVIAWVGPS